MFNILDYPLTVFVFFIMVFMRISGFIFSAPFLGDRQIPVQIKLMLSLMLSFIITPLLKVPDIPIDNLYVISFFAAGEFVFGLMIGFLLMLVFSGILLAGQIAGYQMGLAIANVFDPSTMNRQSIISSLLFWIAMAVFFVSNMHLFLIKALVYSFKAVPVFLEFSLNSVKVMDLQHLFSNLFLVSVQIGSPIMFTLLFLMVSLGLITRLIPQMNIFIVGIPIQILVGLLVLIAMAPLMGRLSYFLLLNHTDKVLVFLKGG